MPDAQPVPAAVQLAINESLALVASTLAEPIVVLGSDALATAVRSAYPVTTVRVFNDTVPVEAAAPNGVSRAPLTPALFAGARLVIAELPKVHAELDEWAELAAAFASPEVVFVGAGRDKHMSHGLNDQLAHSFSEVTASRGVRKARALRARFPRPNIAVTYPRVAAVTGLPFAVSAHGAAFAGTRLDIGTRALLDALDDALHASGISAGTALDLGCGTGILATSLALLRPDMHVIASDISWAAVTSARETADGAGVGARVRTLQQDGTAALEDASVDLVLFNPPFHTGHAVVEDMAHRLFAEAARVLRPGGELLCVFNSHLPHRGALSREVGPTDQLSRNAKFTVTRSVRR